MDMCQRNTNIRGIKNEIMIFTKRVKYNLADIHGRKQVTYIHIDVRERIENYHLVGNAGLAVLK